VGGVVGRRGERRRGGLCTERGGVSRGVEEVVVSREGREQRGGGGWEK